MRLAIFGGQGQVGRAIAALAHQRGISYSALGRAECDVTDLEAVKRVLQLYTVAVNCAAYTAVDQAETHELSAFRVNTDGAANVAVACAEFERPLIHLSTDYVFDGQSSCAIKEDHPPRPINVYGRSKLGGEQKIRALLPHHVILRTSWLFSARGENFVKTILRLAQTHSELRVVDDQIGGPTAADDVATVVFEIADKCQRSGFTNWGIYHFSGAPAVSWFEFARLILAGRDTVVLPVATSDFPRPAPRPPRSVLDCSRIYQAFGIKQPDWRVALVGVREALMSGEKALP